MDTLKWLGRELIWKLIVFPLIVIIVVPLLWINFRWAQIVIAYIIDFMGYDSMQITLVKKKEDNDGDE